MKYLVRDCDPNTGEPDDDGYDDEYVVCEFSKSVHGFKKKQKQEDYLRPFPTQSRIFFLAGRFRGNSR